MKTITLALVLLLLALQAPPNPDDYVGDEDPAHRGQPKTCTNVPSRKAVKHDCKCVKTSCDPSRGM